MKLIALLLVLCCLYGCGDTNEKVVDAGLLSLDLNETEGIWVIIKTWDEKQFFWVSRLSGEGFIQLYNEGCVLTIKPQKDYDSGGFGKKAIAELEAQNENR